MRSVAFLSFLLLFIIFSLTVYANNFFTYSVKDADGQIVPLSKYANAKVVLVVNVASNCGFTYTNYIELSELYTRLHQRGLEILAFPSNQFGEQEPGSNEEIQMFTKNFGISFPVFGKIDVNGPQSDPIYQFLKTFSSDSSDIGWNFTKFLVVNGYPVKRYAARISPKKIEKDILQYLSPSDEI